MEKIKTPSTATVYRMILRGIIPKTKMEHLRRKGRFKRPAETVIRARADIALSHWQKGNPDFT